MRSLSLHHWEAALEAPSWRPDGGREVFLLPGRVCVLLYRRLFLGEGAWKREGEVAGRLVGSLVDSAVGGSIDRVVGGYGGLDR